MRDSPKRRCAAITDAVTYLLSQGVDIDGAQGDGSTALHWAAFNDDLETTKMLLAAGANVKVTTREGGITPLFMACTQRQCGHHRGASQSRRRRELGEGERNHRADAGGGLGQFARR